MEIKHMPIANQDLINRQLKASSEFSLKATHLHANKYCYELVDYKNNRTKVKIICPEHGVFEQTPNNHLTGYGCSKCANTATGTKKAEVAGAEFVTKASKVHKGLYDYSLTLYKNSRTKVKIICPEHGVFEQRPNDHLDGKGCALCGKGSFGFTKTIFKEKCIKNNNGQGILYVLHCFNDNESFIKIGITSKSIRERYSSKIRMPYAYRIIDEIIGDPEYIYDLEKTLHREHKAYKYTPNIDFGGSCTECFKEYNRL